MESTTALPQRSIEFDEPIDPPGGLLHWMRDFDLRLVRLAAATARPQPLRSLAIALSKLGNGWIYLPIGGLLLVHGGLAASRIAGTASLNALLLHGVYPRIKRAFQRRRPFQAAPELPSLLPILDSYSFPSGHAMTLAGVLTPIVMLWPGAALFAALLGGGVAWSRVATSHHYPSDVIAGAALGVGVGYPTTSIVVSLFG